MKVRHCMTKICYSYDFPDCFVNKLGQFGIYINLLLSIENIQKCLEFKQINELT